MLGPWTHLILKHRGVLGDEVDVDVPGPVGDDDHQGEDEEEDEEVRGLGVGAVQQTEHRDQEEDTQGDVKISARETKFYHYFICSNTLLQFDKFSFFYFSL